MSKRRKNKLKMKLEGLQELTMQEQLSIDGGNDKNVVITDGIRIIIKK